MPGGGAGGEESLGAAPLRVPERRAEKVLRRHESGSGSERTRRSH